MSRPIQLRILSTYLDVFTMHLDQIFFFSYIKIKPELELSSSLVFLL